MNSLRNELDRLANEKFNLARWKFISVTVYVIAALGWGDIKPSDPLSGLLLLCCTGFLCAYTDCLYYRRGTATHVIAKFLRENSGTDSESQYFLAYENFVNNCREKRMFFMSDHVFLFFASVILTIGPAFLGRIRYPDSWKSILTIMLVAALSLNIIIFMVYRNKRRRLALSSGRRFYSKSRPKG